jgi:putative NADH-flavin reductase
MRILVLGAAGSVGAAVVVEALVRGHAVTAAVRRPASLELLPPGVDGQLGDAGDAGDVARLSRGHDVLVAATRPPDGAEQEVVPTTMALLDGAGRSGVRVLVVGGAATLTVPGTGQQVLEDEGLVPPEVQPIARASAAQLAVCRASTGVDWTYLSPPRCWSRGAGRAATAWAMTSCCSTGKGGPGSRWPTSPSRWSTRWSVQRIAGGASLSAAEAGPHVPCLRSAAAHGRQHVGLHAGAVRAGQGAVQLLAAAGGAAALGDAGGQGDAHRGLQ